MDAQDLLQTYNVARLLHFLDRKRASRMCTDEDVEKDWQRMVFHQREYWVEYSLELMRARNPILGARTQLSAEDIGVLVRRQPRVRCFWYIPRIRPATFGGAPPGWEYIEAPSDVAARRTDIPASKYPYGVIGYLLPLRKEQCDHFGLEPYRHEGVPNASFS